MKTGLSSAVSTPPKRPARRKNSPPERKYSSEENSPSPPPPSPPPSERKRKEREESQEGSAEDKQGSSRAQGLPHAVYGGVNRGGVEADDRPRQAREAPDVLRIRKKQKSVKEEKDRRGPGQKSRRPSPDEGVRGPPRETSPAAPRENRSRERGSGEAGTEAEKKREALSEKTGLPAEDGNGPRPHSEGQGKERGEQKGFPKTRPKPRGEKRKRSARGEEVRRHLPSRPLHRAAALYPRHRLDEAHGASAASPLRAHPAPPPRGGGKNSPRIPGEGRRARENRV